MKKKKQHASPGSSGLSKGAEQADVTEWLGMWVQPYAFPCHSFNPKPGWQFSILLKWESVCRSLASSSAHVSANDLLNDKCGLRIEETVASENKHSPALMELISHGRRNSSRNR